MRITQYISQENRIAPLWISAAGLLKRTRVTRSISAKTKGHELEQTRAHALREARCHELHGVALAAGPRWETDLRLADLPGLHHGHRHVVAFVTAHLHHCAIGTKSSTKIYRIAR